MLKALEWSREEKEGKVFIAVKSTLIPLYQRFIDANEMVKVGKIDEFNIEDKIAELMEKTPTQLEVTKEAMKLIKEGKEGNVFDETEKDASYSSSEEKKGMFDSVIPG